MNRINTLAELKAERKRLSVKKAELEIILRSDFDYLKKELEPSHLIVKAVSKAVEEKHEDIIEYATNSIVNLAMRKIVFRNSGFITKIIGGFIAKNVANNVIAEKKSNITDWIFSLVNKVTSSKKTASEKFTHAEPQY